MRRNGGGEVTPRGEMERHISAAVNAGGTAARRLMQTHSFSSISELGSFSAGTSAVALALRRVLINLRIPIRAVAAFRPIAVRIGRAGQFERFVRELAFWTGVRRGMSDRALWTALTRGPKILLYHAIGRASEPASCYVVPRRRFEMQMAWLKWRGYRVVSLADLVSTIGAGRLPPSRTIVITFDDGYADNCEEALPILRRYGFAATVFVVSGAVGEAASWPIDTALFGRPLLTAKQIDALIAAGIDIGAHTRTHPALTAIAPDVQDFEISGSRDDLERQHQIRVRTFAYPFGEYTATISERVASAGFEAACCSRSGVNDPVTPLMELRRLEVRGTDSLFDFARLLWRAHRAPRSTAHAAEGATA